MKAFEKSHLVPVIAQDARTGEVLMQAYANKEALDKTLETGFAHYFSRSRNCLWKKGEQSGNVQRVTEILSDCDEDCLIYKIEQTGVACHTGAPSCFFNEVQINSHVPNASVLYRVIDTIKDRRQNCVKGSYVNYLLEHGVDKICKKIGEEATEVVISAKSQGNEGLEGEVADLFFHVLVLLEQLNMPIENVFKVLEDREGKRRQDY